MAASTSGALKAYIEGLGFNLPAFRDGPRPEQAPPYVVTQEGLDLTIDPAARGDFGDPDAELQVIEVASVDLIQLARRQVSPTRAVVAERYGLAEALAHRLHGCQLPEHPAKVTAVRVTGIDRFPIANNRLRSSIALAIHRELLLNEVVPV